MKKAKRIALITEDVLVKEWDNEHDSRWDDL